jgi:hypothetical protein
MIKPEALASHFDRHKNEVELASKFDEAFDITHASRHGDLSLWLCDPKSTVKERFGLQSEILTVYSQHAVTDARVLTAIEHVSRRNAEYKQRIDRLVFIVVHEGDAEITKDLVKKDHDRIIVPIHAEKLRDPARGTHFLRSSIARVTGEIDLFGVSSPISHDKHFFGREELVQSLVVRLGHRGENAGLFGLRKTGKTSVLKAISRRSQDLPWLVEYIDCHNPGVHSARWWMLLKNIAKRLIGDDLELSAFHAQRQYSPISAGLDFGEDVNSISRKKSVERIILLMDEIEYITPSLSGVLGKHWDDDFLPLWQTIRSVHQESDGKLVFLVAGVNPACISEPRIGDSPNPIFQLAEPQYLEPFSVSSVRDMVRTIGRYSGVKFDEDVYGWLASKYGGHPYLVRLACSQVWRDADRTSLDALVSISVKDYEAMSEEIKNRLSQPIRDILLSLVWWYPEEYDLLRILASGDHEFVKAHLADNSGSKLHFARYGILRADDDGEFAISDLRDFLKAHGDKYKSEISPFKRGDLPPEYLPDVPDINLLGKLFEKKTELEILLRKAILLYLGVHHSFDDTKISDSITKNLKSNVNGRDPKGLFIGRRPQEAVQELFTLDLKAVISGNWALFSPLFEGNKSRFEMNMDTVNRARRFDAHTKSISSRDVEEFDNSYGWLLARLRRLPG